MKKILIVEDVDLNLDLLIQLLEDDFEIVAARDGASGIEMAEEHLPDLILMDMSLPVMDGWEATKKIKSSAATQRIPVIGLSAHAMNGDREKALAAGCDDYLTKPVDDILLLSKLEEFLGA
ncbi:MAG: response regulator [Anaerolineales bacterium]|jgi:two-component system cell cycle response regulator DivK